MHGPKVLWRQLSPWMVPRRKKLVYVLGKAFDLGAQPQCSCAGLMSWSKYVRAAHFLNFWHLLKTVCAFYMRLNANGGSVSVSSSVSPFAVWDLAACPIPSGCWSHRSQPREPELPAAREMHPEPAQTGLLYLLCLEKRCRSACIVLVHKSSSPSGAQAYLDNDLEQPG